MSSLRSFFFFILYFLFCVCQNIDAQEIKFTHITPEQGLSANTIYAITQDSRGFMWIATEVGLNRYDGKKIVVYNNDIKDPQSLSDNLVRSLCPDDKGGMWVGTDEGLNYYDPVKNKFKVYQSKENCKDCISNDFVRAIVRDANGNLWIATDFGLNFFDVNTQKFKSYINDGANKISLPNNQLSSLYLDSQGLLWIGTIKSGLIVYDIKKDQFKTYSQLADKVGKNEKTYGRIRALYEDSKHNMWIGTDGGLCFFDRKTATFQYFSDQPSCPEYLKKAAVFSISGESSGNIWITTKTYGLVVYNPKTNKYKNYINSVLNPNSISSNDLYCAFEDNAKSIWVGTYTSGLSIYHRTASQFGVRLIEPGNKFELQAPPFCFLEDSKGVLWIGSVGAGLYIQDSISHDFLNYDVDKNKLSHNILSFYEDQNANVWIGSWGKGFNYFDRKKNAFSKPFTVESSGLTNDNVTCFLPYTKNQIWIGTLNGLNLFDLESKKIIKTITKESGLPAKGIFSLHLDKENVLWIGTNGGGLNSYDLKSGKIQSFLKSDSEQIISN